MNKQTRHHPLHSLFKVLDEKGFPIDGGSGQWHLPSKDMPGRWMPSVPVEPCRSGYHLCRACDLVYWLGPVIWEAEARGKWIEEENKVVVAQSRLVRRVKTWTLDITLLFAADCAENVFYLADPSAPDFHAAREAIQLAREVIRNTRDRTEQAAVPRLTEEVTPESGTRPNAPPALAAPLAMAARETTRAATLAAQAKGYAGRARELAGMDRHEAAAKSQDAASDAAIMSALAVSSMFDVDRFEKTADYRGGLLDYSYRAYVNERQWQAGRLKQYLWP